MKTLALALAVAVFCSAVAAQDDSCPTTPASSVYKAGHQAGVTAGQASMAELMAQATSKFSYAGSLTCGTCYDFYRAISPGCGLAMKLYSVWFSTYKQLVSSGVFTKSGEDDGIIAKGPADDCESSKKGVRVDPERRREALLHRAVKNAFHGPSVEGNLREAFLERMERRSTHASPDGLRNKGLPFDPETDCPGIISAGLPTEEQFGLAFAQAYGALQIALEGIDTGSCDNAELVEELFTGFTNDILEGYSDVADPFVYCSLREEFGPGSTAGENCPFTLGFEGLYQCTQLKKNATGVESKELAFSFTQCIPQNTSMEDPTAFCADCASQFELDPAGEKCEWFNSTFSLLAQITGNKKGPDEIPFTHDLSWMFLSRYINAFGYDDHDLECLMSGFARAHLDQVNQKTEPILSIDDPRLVDGACYGQLQKAIFIGCQFYED